MKVLVTGGAGFIGSHFIRAWLLRHPADEVVNLDCLTYAGSPARLGDVKGNARYAFVNGNICSAELVQRSMSGCETVVHCAAETHVDRSITDAAPFLRTNVEGTHVLLQAAYQHQVKRFIHLSTDEVYGPVLDGAVDEQAPLTPQSPYAASKAAGDLLVQAFQKTYGLPTIIIRPTNIYGPGQFPEKFIPLCITHGLEGRSIPVYGDGKQRRAWLFVADLCEALQLIVERGALGDLYNVAGGHEQENLETVMKVLALLGRPRELIEFVTDRPGHDRRYAMNDAKLRALGWQPHMSFEQGLQETISWYQEHSAWWRPLAQRLREDSYHWLNRPARSGAQPSFGAHR